MKYSISELEQIIKDRRTIYPESYSSRKVHREIVERLLNNAIWAPSHGRTQPWHFDVFLGAKVADLTTHIAATYRNETPGFMAPKYEKMLDRKNHSTAIIAVSMKRGDNPKIPVMDELMAVGAAMQNIQLMACAYGLGSFWQTGVSAYSEATKSFLNLGPDDQCLGFLHLGYPDLEEWPKSQRKPIEYKTTWHEE